jgi:hypothetical protein
MADQDDDTPEQFGTPVGVLALVFVGVVVGPIFLGCWAAEWVASRVKAVARRIRGGR